MRGTPLRPASFPNCKDDSRFRALNCAERHGAAVDGYGSVQSRLGALGDLNALYGSQAVISKRVSTAAEP